MTTTSAPQSPGAAQPEAVRCRPGVPIALGWAQPGSHIRGAPLRAVPHAGHER
jgi:hypothetical protein